MKYLSFLLISFTLYAQYPYEDTLFTYNDKVYPCLITNFTDTHIKLLYSNSIYESVIKESVLKIKLDGYGEVYTTESGFSVNIDSIQSFVETRWEKFAQEKKLREGEEKLLKDSLQSLAPEMPVNRWSFGVLYVPYSSSKIYNLSRSGVYPEELSVYSIIINETYMEGQFAYLASANLSVTFDIGYTLAFTEERKESHTAQDNYSYQSGTFDSRNLKLFDFMVGLKIYFKNFLEEKATAYWLAGIGKQFAFGSVTHEYLFSSNPQTVGDNADEYLEDLNSPWHFNIGFGAEYFFNESLSLFSVMRFSYSIVSGEYNSTTLSGTQRITSMSQYKNSEITTDFGLGLNFYF